MKNTVEVNDQIGGDTDDDDHEEDERDSKRLRGESAQNLQPEKMYKCEERKCKDHDKDFKTAAGKERHDRCFYMSINISKYLFNLFSGVRNTPMQLCRDFLYPDMYMAARFVVTHRLYIMDRKTRIYF